MHMLYTLSASTVLACVEVSREPRREMGQNILLNNLLSEHPKHFPKVETPKTIKMFPEHVSPACYVHVAGLAGAGLKECEEDREQRPGALEEQHIPDPKEGTERDLHMPSG